MGYILGSYFGEGLRQTSHRGHVLSPERSARWAFTESLLEERKREERQKKTSPGKPPKELYSRLVCESKREPPQHHEPSEVQSIRAIIRSGVGSPGTGMRLNNLRKKHPEAYYRIVSGKRGQGKLPV